MFDNQLAAKAAENMKKVRDRKPLVHNITNFVVMNYTANALLACGASPVMAHAPEEVEEMAGLASALVLNIGTLTPYWVDSMVKAGRRANEKDIPVILDPVGSGATTLRTASATRIADRLSLQVIRANASEILSLSQGDSHTKGVDAIHSVEDAVDVATGLAKTLGTTIAITGPEDLVTDGERLYRIFNGHPLMGCVTGTGCTATALIGAFLGIDSDPVEATVTALAAFGVAGELAAAQTQAPGTFQMALLDALYMMGPEDLNDKVKIQRHF